MRTTPTQARTSPILMATLLVLSGLAFLPPAAGQAPPTPKVQALEWQDIDQNGYLDSVQLTFDTTMSDDTVRPSDFTISSNGQQVTATGFLTGTANDAVVTLRFPEGMILDAGVLGSSGSWIKPILTYAVDSNFPLKSTGGVAATGSFYTSTALTTGTTEVARPFAMAAYGFSAAGSGDDLVVVAFSERVLSGGVALGIANFAFSGCSVGATPISVSTATSNLYTVRANGELAAGDITNPGSPNACRLVVNAAPAITDVALNAILDFDAGAGVASLPIGGPTLLRVNANAGDRRVIVEFTGPIGSNGGGPLGTTDLEAVLGGNSGTAFSGFNSPIGHSAGSNRILLTSTALVTLADVTTGSPSQVRATASVYGPVGPTITSVPAPLQVQSVIHSTVLSDTVTAATTTSSGDSQGYPGIAAMATLDLYTGNPVTGVAVPDGCIDTVRITFTESMSDAALTNSLDSAAVPGAPNLWQIRVPGTTAGTYVIATAPSTGGFSSVEAGDTATVPASVVDDNIAYLRFDPGTCDTANVFRTFAQARVSFCDAISGAATTNAGAENVAACGTTGDTPLDIAPTGPRGFGPTTLCSASPSCPFLNRVRMFPATDGAAPIILEARSQDTGTMNGKVDRIQIRFSEPVNDGALVASEWQVRDENQVVYSISGVTTGDTANDDTILLTLSEKPYFDSGMVPDVAYTFGAIRIKDQPSATTGQNSLGSVQFFGTAGILSQPLLRERDTVSPRPATVIGTVGSTFLYVAMSEKFPMECVYTSADTSVGAGDLRVSPCRGKAAGTIPVAGDPDFGLTIGAMVGAVGSVVDRPGGTTGAFDAGECVYQQTALASVAAGNVRLTYCDGFPPLSVVQAADTAEIGDATVAPTVPIKYLDMDGGAAETPIRYILPNMINYRGSATGGATGVIAAQIVLPPDDTTLTRVRLTLNAALTSADMTGDCIQFAATYNDDAGNLARPQDTETPSTPGATCVGITASASPTLVSATTVDADADGSVDALKLTFSGAVNDAIGATPTADWTVKYGPTGATVTVPTLSVVTGAFAGGSAVIAGNRDAGITLTNTGSGDIRFLDITGSTAGWNAGECVYRSTNAAVDLGDMRVTRCGQYPARSMVAFGDRDIGGTLAVVTNARYADLGTPASLDAGECVYISTDATVDAGELRVNACSQAAANSASVAGSAFCRGKLEANAPQDNILYVCFREELNADLSFKANTGALPSISYSGSSLFDAGGQNPIGAFTDVVTVDGAAPALVRATGNPGSSAFELRFSEMVVAGGSPISASSLLYSNSLSGSEVACPSGANNAATLATYSAPASSGFLDIAGTVNAPFSYYDIAGCTSPTQFSDGVRPNTGVVQEPTSAGGKFAVDGPLGDNGIAVDAGIRRFVDNGKPSISQAAFVDFTGDGVVDAVQVRLNEHIDDSTVNTAVVSPNGPDWTITAGGNAIEITSITSGGNVLAPASTYTCSPGPTLPLDKAAPYDGANDQYLFLCLQTTPGVPRTTFGLGTGLTGSLSYAPYGARIRDRSGLTPSALHEMDNTAAPVTILDKARPVILTAPAPDARSAMAETADRNRDGKLDAIKVTFSEKIDDSTFAAIDWSIQGHAILGLDTEGLAQTTVAATTVDDTTVWLAFAPGTTPDTGLGSGPTQTAPNPLPPTLSYSDTGGMKDLAGNGVRGRDSTPGAPFATACAATTPNPPCLRDGAAPVLMSVQATIGQTAVAVTFSEPVRGSGSNGQITLADIGFQNNAAGGATAVSSVLHERYDTGLTVFLNQPVTAADMSEDKLVFVTASIVSRNEAGSSSPFAADPTTFPHPLNLFNLYGPLSGEVGDTIPPPAITDLEVTAIDAGSATLAWTTPTAEDIADGFFEVFWCATADPCALTQSNFQTLGTVESGLTPVNSGEEQTFVLTGLPEDGVEYQAIIRLVDNSGNPSDISNVVEFVPKEYIDEVPASVTGLTVAAVTEGSITVEWTVPAPEAGTAIGGYRIVVKTSSTLTWAAFKTSTMATFTLSPATLAAAGSTQRAVITEPSPGVAFVAGTTYYVYVAPLDDQLPVHIGQPAVVDAVPQEVIIDTTDPGKVTGLAAAAGSDGTTADLTWTSRPGSEGVESYHIEVATVDAQGNCPGTFSPATPDEVTGNSVTVTGLTAGTTYCFRVWAADSSGNDGPRSDAVRFTPGAIASADLAAVNTALQGSLAATWQGVDADGNTKGVKLTWDIPGAVAGQTLAGFQIWRCVQPLAPGQTCTAGYEILAEVGPTTNTYTHAAGQVDADGTADAYLVTAFYGQSSSAGKATQSEGPSSLPGVQANSPVLATQSSGTDLLGSWWFWVIVGVVALLVIALIAWLILRGRKKGGDEGAFASTDAPAEGGDATASWDATPAEGSEASAEPTATWDASQAAEPEAAPAQEAAVGASAQQAVQQTADAETSYLSCPQCSTVFRATGRRPFVAQCPTCGVKGRFA